MHDKSMPALARQPMIAVSCSIWWTEFPAPVLSFRFRFSSLQDRMYSRTKKQLVIRVDRWNVWKVRTNFANTESRTAIRALRNAIGNFNFTDFLSESAHEKGRPSPVAQKMSPGKIPRPSSRSA